ncbi:hypothetical protein [Lutibaculum baratangense]|nr:hypothetical protein [Lutibaculum baratangense]
MEIAQTNPAIESPDAADVSESGVIDENTESSVAQPDAADAVGEAAAKDVEEAVRDAGEAVSAGPPSPAEVDPEDTRVADEAARENRIIQQRAEEDPEAGTVPEAQRVVEDLDGAEDEAAR